jgi:uncharacterized phiE125 gp8 family phage protein
MMAQTIAPAFYQTNASPPDNTPLSLEDAKAHLRIDTSSDDALIAGLIRAATEMCEAFIGQLLIERAVSDILPASSDWQRVAQSPVRSITGVEVLPTEGSAYAMPVADYAVDIDAGGTGWVRILTRGSGTSATKRVRISYRSGGASGANAVPEAIRLGVLHMVAHLFANRDAVAAPPAAIVALWRPYRRLRLL